MFQVHTMQHQNKVIFNYFVKRLRTKITDIMRPRYYFYIKYNPDDRAWGSSNEASVLYFASVWFQSQEGGDHPD
jgi:hypothetical protein